MSQDDLLEEFKDEFNATEAVDQVNHETDAWACEDNVVACIPEDETKFGAVDFDNLERPERVSLTYVDLDDSLEVCWYFENGNARHHIKDEYVSRVLKLLDVGGMYIHDHVLSNFSHRSGWPVAIESDRGYNFIICPVIE